MLAALPPLSVVFPVDWSTVDRVGQLTPAQIAWAKSHEWFDQDNGDGSIDVYDTFTAPTRGEVESAWPIIRERSRWQGSYLIITRVIRFGGTFAELRAWAGY